jgi:ankyrin repeat protein
LTKSNLNLQPLEGHAMVPSKRLSLLVLLMFCFVAIAIAPALAGKLTDAVKAKDVALVRNLLAAGEDVQEKVRGDYPLNAAAIFGPVESVAVLLEKGADIDRPGRGGLHPLHNAIELGHKEIVALLIRKGALVNAQDNRGRTPLHSFACSAGSDIEIAKMLLAAGADPKIIDVEYHETPLNCAVVTVNPELVELLVAAHVDVNHVDIDGGTALHLASVHSHHKIAKLLIAAGVDVNIKNKVGHTALFYAQDDAMRKLLIDSGAK